MTVGITANLKAYREDRLAELKDLPHKARYASFDYCFNYFQQARDDEDTARLADEDHLQQSCLQLGFYLASWGMMRGSSGLLKRSVAGLVPVVERIAIEPASIWKLDVDTCAEQADEVLALIDRVQNAFLVGGGFSASDTLVTKTILGVFGCVPALDRYFRIGFRKESNTRPTLKAIGEYYRDNQAKIDAAQERVFTLDFATGVETERQYPKAKIIDMVFFQEGINSIRVAKHG
jgi:hypothetical protein